MPDTKADPGGAPARRRIGRAVVPTDERIIFDCRPSLWFIVFRSLRAAFVPIVVLILFAAMVNLAAWITRYSGWNTWAYAPLNLIAACAGGIIVILLAWNFLEWLCCRYVLTGRRAIVIFGVLNQHLAELTLDRVQNVAASKPLLLRLVGVGHVGLASAGTASFEVVWRYLKQPDRVALDVRRAAAGKTPRKAGLSEPTGPSRPGSRPIIIGLAGGIGSGKSTVGRMFEELGCVLVDSDAEAREALRRPDVIRTLRSWWGDSILDGAGQVDRRAVAKIVFGNASQRDRLERLIHPLILESRERQIEEAGRAGRPGVIIDAPLLFEAGLNARCDAVVFVESPFELRLERVKAARGWDESELRLREKAQLPLEEKRERSDYSVVNTGDLDAVRKQVASIFTELTEATDRPNP